MELLATRREPGVLSRVGGLIRSAYSRLDSATGFKKQQTPALIGDSDDALRRIGNVTPSLAAILRPQAAYRWLLPYLASITPTYVESILRGALAGNHVQSWELFDLMMDTSPELASCVQEYIEGVLSHKIIFEPHHEEEEEPSDLAMEKAKVVAAALRSMRPDPASDENALRDTLRDLLFARFHGQSVCEVDWLDTFGTGERYIKKVQDLGAVQCVRSTFWVHPVCYAWGVDGRLGLRGELTADRGSQYGPGRELAMRPGTDRLGMSMVQPPAWNWISSQPRPSNLSTFPRNKFLISVFKSKAGTALGGSCLRPLAAIWVYSNFCSDYMMNTAQLFQVPFRKATYAPNTPPAVQEEIKHMLQSMGSTAWGLFPQGVTVDFESASTNSGSSPAAYIIHYADAAIRKVVLHQTMTGGSHDSMGKGGGKAFGEVESDTKDQCIEAGAEFAAEQVNSQLIPMVLELNYGKDGDQEAPVCKLVDSEVGGLADAQRDQVLSQIVDIPSSYVRRKYGIPKAGPDDEIAGVEQGIAGATAKQAQQNVEADRDQKAKAAKQQADALAKQPKVNGAPQNGNGQPGAQPPKPGQVPKQPGQQEKQPGAEDNDGMDGRAAGNGHRFDLEALEASSEAGHPFYGNQWTSEEGNDVVPLSKKVTLGSEVIWKDDEGKVHHGQLGHKEEKSIPWEDAKPEERKWSNGKEGAEKKAIVETGKTNVDEVTVKEYAHPSKSNTTVRELVPTGKTHLVPHERLAQMKKGGFRQREVNSSSVGLPSELQAADAGSGKGCLMAMLPEADAKRFVEWSKAHIDKDALVEDGIEAEAHVTVFYGFNLGFDTDQLAELLKRRKPVDFEVGKVSRFECPNYDVLKCDIDSPALENLNNLIAGKFAGDVTPSEHAYHPHLTLAYVKKGSSKELDGQDPFSGEQFTCADLLFSEPEHANRETIALQARHTAVKFDTEGKDTAMALHETAKPLLDRIDAIAKVPDAKTRTSMMRKLLKDMPHIAAAMVHDDAPARAIAPAVVKRFVQKLAKESKKGSAKT